MSNGAYTDYDFGPKRHWRRWIWNRIAERADKEGMVVYLPGENDFDRPLALQHGFKDNNLIGVERDKRTLKHLRNGGKLIVEGDVFEVALAILASGKRVSVINADLTKGLCLKDSAKILDIIGHPKSIGITLAINLQRGRDPEMNPFREFFPELFNFLRLKARDSSSRFDAKHRGMQLFLGFIRLIAEWYEAPKIEDLHKVIRATACVFHSYRSIKLATFDSVVFKNPFTAEMYELRGYTQKEFNAVLKDMLPLQMRMSTAATMAHRTMRGA